MKIGIQLDCSLKCHLEIAGEGIEYAWALAKLFYRRASIEQKRTKEKFRKLVSSATDPNSVLNLTRIRFSSKKARSYMKMYMVIHNMNLEGITMDGANELIDKHSVLESAMKLYLKLKKKGKTHRSVLDRNRSDVNEIENSSFSFSNTNGQSGNKIVVKKEMIDLLVQRMNVM